MCVCVSELYGCVRAKGEGNVGCWSGYKFEHELVHKLKCKYKK